MGDLLTFMRIRLNAALDRLDESVDQVRRAQAGQLDEARSIFIDARQNALDTMRQVRDQLNLNATSQ